MGDGKYQAPMQRGSSWQNAIAAYQPYYAPPTVPVGTLGIGSDFTKSPEDASTLYWDAPCVNRKYSQLGFRYLYSRGARITRQFIMNATGQVNSSSYQPQSAFTWFAPFYDALFGAGYPRNLGLSEKVPSIPPQALGVQAFQQVPRPQYTRSIFTNRSFAQPGQPLPAQGINVIPGSRNG